MTRTTATRELADQARRVQRDDAARRFAALLHLHGGGQGQSAPIVSLGSVTS